MRYNNSGELLVTTGGATTASPAAYFEATGAGAGYAAGDLLTLYSDGSWRNGANTIAQPTGGSYGPVGGTASVTTAGIGTSTDAAAPANGSDGDLIAQAKRTNIELATATNLLSGRGSFCYYQVGAGPILAGWVEASYDNAGSITGITIYNSTGAVVAGASLAVPDAGTAIPTATVLLHSSMGAAATATIKNTAGNLRSLIMSHTNPAKRYLQLFNSATNATAGDTPLMSFSMPGSGTTSDGGFVLDQAYLGDLGQEFTTGIVWGYSTTPNIFTAGDPAEVSVNGRYV